MLKFHVPIHRAAHRQQLIASGQQLLFRIQFDDQLLIDRRIDVFTLR
jgi:hypothetical protein